MLFVGHQPDFLRSGDSRHQPRGSRPEVRKKKNPWQVRPYLTWPLTLPYGTKGRAVLGGAAYDPRTGRIFVSQQFGDGVLPVIHVFTV